MKKLWLIILALSLTMSVSAQYRDVKLPEKPKQRPYEDIERQDAGVWFAIELDGGSSIMSEKTNTQYVNLGSDWLSCKRISPLWCWRRWTYVCA